MHNNKILVTGGTGYIGSHTVCRLLDIGYNVISVDNLSNSYEYVNELITDVTGKKPVFIKADICNREDLRKIYELHKDITGIIHFAALKSVNDSVHNPLKYYRNNLSSLTNLLELSALNNIKFLVFSSSCTVYGQPAVLPVNENTPTMRPLSPYGNTKKISEEILEDFCLQNKKCRVISLRYFNPVGAHPSGMIGEFPIGIPDNLMPYITQTAYGIREEVKVYGGDYKTPDGTAIRDYIHIIDLVDAHLKALERIINDKMEKNYEVFNIGIGRGYSVLEVINTFMEVNKVKVPYKITNRRFGDIEQIWTETLYANKKLRWKARYTLSDMVRHAWKWEKHLRKKLIKKNYETSMFKKQK